MFLVINKAGRRALTGLVCTMILAAVAVSVGAQEGGTALYTYDANGRLKMVVLPSGEAAVYDYDPAGNITAIRRIIAKVVLLEFSPHEGTAGDRVTFSGVGFGAKVEDNTVSFNGVNARVVTASPKELVAEVPEGATTGFVRIAAPNGSVTTETTGELFTLSPRIRVSPATAALISSQSLQFTAVITSVVGDRSVRWSVNGIEGGNNAVGTISASGLYMAPDIVPRFQPIRVRATSAGTPTLFGAAQVVVQDRLIVAASANVSVRRGLGEPVPAVGAPVSVRRGSGITEPVPAASAPVSVQRGPGIREPVPAISPLVSIQRGFGITEPIPAIGPLLSVTTGPSISAISPTTLARGATVSITLSGANLGGATALGFIDKNGMVDSSIAVSNVAANANGSELTATLTVAENAALGRRVVVISAAAGDSLTVDLGSNTLEIVAP